MDLPLDLANYGLDSFSFTFSLTGDTMKVVTHPFQDDAFADQLLGILPTAREDDCLEISGFMDRSGSVSIKGIKPRRQPEVASLLRLGRDKYARQTDNLLSEELVISSAETLILNGLTINEMPESIDDIQIGCGNCLIKQLDEDKTLSGRFISGAHCWYPADFQADFNNLQRERVFNKMIEILPTFIEEIERDIDRRHNQLNILLDYKDRHSTQ